MHFLFSVRVLRLWWSLILRIQWIWSSPTKLLRWWIHPELPRLQNQQRLWLGMLGQSCINGWGYWHHHQSHHVWDCILWDRWSHPQRLSKQRVEQRGASQQRIRRIKCHTTNSSHRRLLELPKNLKTNMASGVVFIVILDLRSVSLLSVCVSSYDRLFIISSWLRGIVSSPIIEAHH